MNLHTEIDTTGRTEDRRSDFDAVYGDWEALREAAGAGGSGGGNREVRAAPGRAEENPAGLSDEDYLSLLSAEGADLDALAARLTRVRQASVGEAVGYVVNRNINFTDFC